MNAEGTAMVEMPRYRSHKTVWALRIKEVISRGTDATTDENELVDIRFEDPRYAPMELVSLRGKPTPQAGWYYVQYKDGYFSFSPAEAFEEGNTPEAIAQVADRARNEDAPEHKQPGYGGIGWAVKQMHNGARLARRGWNGKGLFIFLVQGSTFQVNRPPLLGIYPEGTEINYRPHVDIKNVDGTIVPWNASQSDLLATDWEIASA